MEQIRSFIAIELPDGLKLELSSLQAMLRQPDDRWVKWVNPQGIHLTLKFLGNIPADKISPVSVAMEAAVNGIPPFNLEVSNLGAFPNLRQVQIIWVGVSGETELLRKLQQRLDSQLKPLGFNPEKRGFTAHLTLGRLRNQAPADERLKLGQLITTAEFVSTHVIEVKAINLMKSQLTREGAIYSRAASVSLK